MQKENMEQLLNTEESKLAVTKLLATEFHGFDETGTHIFTMIETMGKGVQRIHEGDWIIRNSDGSLSTMSDDEYKALENE